VSKFYIETRYLENYGDRDKPYWKFKGGDTYAVSGFERIQDAVAWLHAHLEPDAYPNSEFPVKWFETYEEWEAQLPKDKEYADFLKSRVKEIAYNG